MLRSLMGAAAAVSLVSSAPFAQVAPTPGPQINTTGRAEVKVAPDRATVVIGVETRGPTAASAAADNSRRQRLAIDAIKALGIPSEQIRTEGFNVQPETQYDRTGQNAPKVMSYLVTNSVVVELRRMDQVGTVIDAALRGGSNVVRSLSFAVANPDSARRVALAEAVGRAKADAEVMARAAGGSLGALLELTTSGYEGPQPMVQTFQTKAVMRLDEVVIQPGEQPVAASVSARWAFIPGR